MQIRVRQHGTPSETLPLVLLPGTLCDARIFGPLQQRLAGVESRVVLTLETRSMREAAEEVLAVAPEHFALLGFSLGGMVAMEAALRAPSRVRGLALVSTTPLPVPPDRHSTRWANVEEARTLGLVRFVRERLWPEYGVADTCATSLLALLETMAESLGDAVFACQTEMALGRQDYRHRLAALTCPTLVVAGQEDRLCPPGAQEELIKALPHCSCIMLPRAGHFALFDNADEVASAVAAWFNTVDRCANVAGDSAPVRADPKESE